MKKERMEKIGKTFLEEDLLRDLPVASSKSRDDDDDDDTPIYKSGATSSNTPALDSFIPSKIFSNSVWNKGWFRSQCLAGQ